MTTRKSRKARIPTRSFENESSNENAAERTTCWRSERERQAAEDEDNRSDDSDDTSVVMPGAVPVRGSHWSPQDEEDTNPIPNEDTAAVNPLDNTPVLQAEIAPNEQDIEKRIEERIRIEANQHKEWNWNDASTNEL